MPFFDVIYNEPNISSYEGIKFKYHKDGEEEQQEEFFNSGDFCKDWNNMFKYYIEHHLYGDLNASSSYDHFLMDGDPFPYKIKYLVVKGEETLFEFPEKLTQDQQDHGLLFYVPEGTDFTWKEFQEYCEQ